MPITILVEVKDDADSDLGDSASSIPLPIDAAALDALDAEIRSVFPADRLITPDDVRGARPTLEEAVLEDGWPTLGESRGKVMFLLDNERRVPRPTTSPATRPAGPGAVHERANRATPTPPS